MHYQSQFTGLLFVKKFFGIRLCRSVWRDTVIRTRPYYDVERARSELQYLIDVVVPATGVKIVSYSVESELTDMVASPCHDCNAPKQCCPCK